MRGEVGERGMAEITGRRNPRVKVGGWARLPPRAASGSTEGGAELGGEGCVEILRGGRIEDAVMVVGDGVASGEGTAAKGATRFAVDFAFGPDESVAGVFGKLRGYGLDGAIRGGRDATLFVQGGSRALMSGLLCADGTAKAVSAELGLAELTAKAIFADLPAGHSVTLGALQVVGGTVCDLLDALGARSGLGLELCQEEDGRISVSRLNRPVVQSASAALDVVRKAMSNARWDEERQQVAVHTAFLFELVGPGGQGTRRLNIVGLTTAVLAKGQGSDTGRSVQKVVARLAPGDNLSVALAANADEENEGRTPFMAAAAAVKAAEAAGPESPPPQDTRESKLLRILQNSLHPSAYVTVLAVLNPAASNAPECRRVLHFARNCLAAPAATTGEHQLEKDALIRNNLELKRQLEELNGLYMKQKLYAGLPHAQDPVKPEFAAKPSPPPSAAVVPPPPPPPSRTEAKITAPHEVLVNQAIVKHVGELAHKDVHQHTLRLLDAEKKVAQERLMSTKELQEKVAELKNELVRQKESFAFDLGTQKTEFSVEHLRLTEENAHLREDLNRLLASRSQETRAKEEHAVKSADFEKIITAEVERKARGNVDAVLKSKDVELSTVRAELEGELRNAAHQINVEKAEHAKTRSALAASLAAVQEECRYLYKYAVMVTDVMKMIAEGKFPLVEKDGLGVRRFELPAKYTDAKLDVAGRCAFIKACLDGGEELLSKQVAHLALQSGGPAEMDQLRAQARQLRDKEKARIEAEIMDELSDDATIRYIHDLEAENKKLSDKAKTDLRMIIDLRLALQSKDRIIAAAAKKR